MENTLHHGEHLIISDLFYTPRRGDIIVCEDYSKSLSDPIVKRIIAVGGDRIQINALGEVYVNGERLTEDYISRKPASNGKPEIYNSIDMIVPEGKLFVMGDNRNNSTDSRHIGTIDEDSVLGKVLFRFYPFDKFGEV
jgi:signal peptidase I